ncbi:MAG: Bax inhibitor-1/YccA family protein [Phycisphaerales bacterium]
MLRTSNPVLTENMFANFRGATLRDASAAAARTTMTAQGAASKTMILVCFCIATSVLSYGWLNTNPALAIGALIGSLVLGLIAGLTMSFKPAWSPVLAPFFALVEGFFVGTVSSVYANMAAGTKLGGATGSMIVLSAATLTFAILMALLLAYKTGLIKATAGFRRMVVAATGGICIYILATLVLSVFGVDLGFLRSGWIGIGITAFIVVIASLNLVLDFDMIEQGEARRLPRYMEWYLGFGLLVTLVWLYVEVLRLLALLAKNR